MTKSLQTWASHLKDKEESESFKQLVSGSRAVLDRLNDMIEKKKKESKSEDYENASWPFFRADSDGYNRALSEVQGLLSLTKD